MGKGKQKKYTVAPPRLVSELLMAELIALRDNLMNEDDSQHTLDAFEELADVHALIHVAYSMKGVPIGYLIELPRGDSGVSLVESIYVLTKYRSSGVARAFMAQLTCQRNFLYVAVINDRAKRLYEHLGYHVVSEAPRYMGMARYSDAETSLASNVSSDALLMANYDATSEGFGQEVVFD